jgi:hypothetical protein
LEGVRQHEQKYVHWHFVGIGPGAGDAVGLLQLLFEGHDEGLLLMMMMQL